MSVRLAQQLRPGAVKGCMRNMIVVKLEDERFQEALFVLRDDYFSGGDRERLLADARRAAMGQAGRMLPPRVRRFPWSFVLGLLLGAALTAVCRLPGLW